MPETAPQQVVILGAGFIGLSFAAAFSDAGWSVTLVEPDAGRREAASAGVAYQLEAAELAGLLAGGGQPVDICAEPGGRLRSASLVIECGPEDLTFKQAAFADLLSRTGPKTVLATASSAIPMSRIVPGAAGQARCLVAHPVNPPAVLRLIELAPAPNTSAETMEMATAFFASANFAAVKLGHEIEGFILNRLQGAVLREAYRLVDEGVTDVEGVDTVMRLGLGPRWALSGPFETAELNTPGGIRAHAARLGPAYKRMGEARGETVDWRDALIDRVAAERRAICPEADLPRRAAWRPKAVARLVALRDRLLAAADD